MAETAKKLLEKRLLALEETKKTIDNRVMVSLRNWEAFLKAQTRAGRLLDRPYINRVADVVDATQGLYQWQDKLYETVLKYLEEIERELENDETE